MATKLERDTQATVATAPHQGLHIALDAWIAEFFAVAHTSVWSKIRWGMAKRLKAHCPDMQLSALDLNPHPSPSSKA